MFVSLYAQFRSIGCDVISIFILHPHHVYLSLVITSPISEMQIVSTGKYCVSDNINVYEFICAISLDLLRYNQWISATN